MAVAIDATMTGGTGAHGGHDQAVGNASSPLDTTLLTIGSSATLLLVGVNFESDTPAPVITWDQGGTNQSLTALGTATGMLGAGHYANFFGLVKPTAGTKTLRVAFSGVVNTYVMAVSFTGTKSDTVANACYAFATAKAASSPTVNNMVTSSASIAVGDMWFAQHENAAPTPSPFFGWPAATAGGGIAGTGLDLDASLGDALYYHYGSGAGATVTPEADNSGTGGDWSCVVIGIAAAPVVPPFVSSIRNGLPINLTQ